VARAKYVVQPVNGIFNQVLVRDTSLICMWEIIIYVGNDYLRAEYVVKPVTGICNQVLVRNTSLLYTGTCSQVGNYYLQETW
jgi:hypothetical protein